MGLGEQVLDVSQFHYFNILDLGWHIWELYILGITPTSWLSSLLFHFLYVSRQVISSWSSCQLSHQMCIILSPIYRVFNCNDYIFFSPVILLGSFPNLADHFWWHLTSCSMFFFFIYTSHAFVLYAVLSSLVSWDTGKSKPVCLLSQITLVFCYFLLGNVWIALLSVGYVLWYLHISCICRNSEGDRLLPLSARDSSCLYLTRAVGILQFGNTLLF